MPGSSRSRSTKYAETELFLDYLADRHATKKPLSMSTVRLYRGIINEFLTWQKGTTPAPSPPPIEQKPTRPPPPPPPPPVSQPPKQHRYW